MVLIPDESNFALMQQTEKEALANISSTIEDNGTILEIGSWLLGSTSIIASNTKSIVYAFDVYDSVAATKFDDSIKVDMGDINWYRQAEAKVLGLGQARSAKNLQKYISPRFPNIKCITNTKTKENYNYLLKLLTGGIDMYFEDGDHSNPVIEQHLSMFVPLIKPNGYFVVHDFEAPYANYNDLNKLVNNIISNTKTWKLVNKVDYLVILQKKA
jgi:hypothetical protein